MFFIAISGKTDYLTYTKEDNMTYSFVYKLFKCIIIDVTKLLHLTFRNAKMNVFMLQNMFCEDSRGEF